MALADGTWNATKAASNATGVISKADELPQSVTNTSKPFSLEVPAGFVACFYGVGAADANSTLTGALTNGVGFVKGAACSAPAGTTIKACAAPKTAHANAFKSALALMTLAIYAATLV